MLTSPGWQSRCPLSHKHVVTSAESLEVVNTGCQKEESWIWLKTLCFYDQFKEKKNNKTAESVSLLFSGFTASFSRHERAEDVQSVAGNRSLLFWLLWIRLDMKKMSGKQQKYSESRVICFQLLTGRLFHGYYSCKYCIFNKRINNHLMLTVMQFFILFYQTFSFTG